VRERFESCGVIRSSGTNNAQNPLYKNDTKNIIIVQDDASRENEEEGIIIILLILLPYSDELYFKSANFY